MTSAGPSVLVLLSSVCAGLGVALAVSPPGRTPHVAAAAVGRSPVSRLLPSLGSLLAGCAAWVFVGGAAGVVAGPVTAVVAWTALARAEPAEERRRRERIGRELPAVVELLGATLRSGAAPEEGLALVVAALPGPAAEVLVRVESRLRLGIPAGQVWGELERDPAWCALARTMARSAGTGASVVDSVARLADELDRESRADVEDRARSVGVRAAVPLGVCLLPSFLLLGIVPTVAGLLSRLTS